MKRRDEQVKTLVAQVKEAEVERNAVHQQLTEMECKLKQKEEILKAISAEKKANSDEEDGLEYRNHTGEWITAQEKRDERDIPATEMRSSPQALYRETGVKPRMPTPWRFRLNLMSFGQPPRKVNDVCQPYPSSAHFPTKQVIEENYRDQPTTMCYLPRERVPEEERTVTHLQEVETLPLDLHSDTHNLSEHSVNRSISAPST